MKRYRWHPCGDRHTTWLELGGCIWPRSVVAGDGPFAAASCGARDIVLYPTAEQAWARKHRLDREGCRAKCHQHHDVILIEGALGNAKPTAAVTRRATTPAAPPTPKPDRPTCGRPRTNGEPCQRPQGWGADPGQLWCRDHGGSTVERRAEAERLVERALVFAQLSEKARTTGLTAEEQQEAEAAARDVFMARRRRRGISPAGLLAYPSGPPVVEVPGSTAPSLGFLIAALSRSPAGGA